MMAEQRTISVGGVSDADIGLREPSHRLLASAAQAPSMHQAAPTKFSLRIDDLERVLLATRADWEKLRGRRIFVTGGTGFFGKWLLETFAYANEMLELECQLVVLTRDHRRFRARMPHLFNGTGIMSHSGDVRNFDFPAGPFSHVIHAATEASDELNRSSPRTMFDAIATGTRRVLDVSIACGAEQVLLISSGAVYGQQPPGMARIPEDYAGGPDPLSTSSAYGEGKRVAEMLCAIAHSQHNLHVSIARCFAFVGPFLPLDRHFAVGNFLRDALCGKPVVVRGDPRTRRSYLYAADLALWLWTILFRGESCRPYNVGSDRAMSIGEIADAVARLPSTPVDVQVEGVADPSMPPSGYVPSIERARRELGLDVDTDFQSAAARTFHWHRQAGEFATHRNEGP